MKLTPHDPLEVELLQRLDRIEAGLDELVDLMTSIMPTILSRIIMDLPPEEVAQLKRILKSPYYD